MKISIKYKITFILLVFLVFVLGGNQLFSQFTGYGNDQRHQASFPISKVEKVPPIETDMSSPCQLGYSIVEKLAKSSSCDYLKDKLKYSSLDTLKYYAGFIFEVVDYSPSLFRRYNSTVNSFGIEADYKSNPSCIFAGTQAIIIDKYFNLIGADYSFLYFTHYILRVRIDSVISGKDTTGIEPISWINVSATVLEQIKGRKLPSNCKSESEVPNTGGLVQDETCLNFGYVDNWETGTGFGISNLPKGRMKTVRAGDEYYVFLKHITDNVSTDIITPESRFEATGGLFQVANDRIYDPDNFWKLGEQPLIRDFKHKITKMMDTIRSWHGTYSDILDYYSDESNRLNVYPLPAQENTTIEFILNEPGNVWIKLYDLTGKLISSATHNSLFEGINRINLDLSSLTSGMYRIELITGSIYHTVLLPKY